MLFQQLYHPGEVDQRAAQAVDLVDDDAIHPPGSDVRNEAFEGRAVHIAAGEAAVVVAVRETDPARARLAGDVGFARQSLRVEGVELLFQPFG